MKSNLCQDTFDFEHQKKKGDKMNEWKNPFPLRRDRSSLICYPANALPPILRDMAFAVSESTSTDVAMAGTALISALSYTSL